MRFDEAVLLVWQEYGNEDEPPPLGWTCYRGIVLTRGNPW